MSIFRYSVKEHEGAAARIRYYRCPDCGQQFGFQHHPADSPPPDHCPLCMSSMEDAQVPVFVPAAPGIRKSPLVRSVDQTYRAMEEASIQRSKDAESMAWDQAHAAGMTDAQIRDTKIADMSSIKITNMRDPSEMREGDTAAITPPANTVVRNMQSLAAQGMGGGFNPLAVNGQAVPPQMFAQAAGEGPDAHYHTGIRQGLQEGHAERAWKMQKSGEMGSYSGRG